MTNPVADLSEVLPGELHDDFCHSCGFDIRNCDCPISIPDKDAMLDEDPEYQEWLDYQEKKYGMINDEALDFIKEGG